MKSVVLAAGLGKRLQPLTLKTPKPMIEVAGRPIIAYILDALPPSSEIIVVVHYLADKIKDFIGDDWKGTPVRYVFQDELAGTGAALSESKRYLKGERFLVVMADDIYSAEDLKELTNHDYAILGKEMKKPGRFGTLEINDQNQLSEIKEAGSGDRRQPYIVNAAVYMLDDKYFNLEPVLTPKKEIGLPQTMAQLTKKGMTIKIIKAREWYPIGTPEELEKVRAIFSARN